MTEQLKRREMEPTETQSCDEENLKKKPSVEDNKPPRKTHS